MKGELSTFALDFRAQLQANAESQRVAQAAHEQQYQNDLDEIKALLASQLRASTATKRPAASELPMDLDHE